MLCFMQEKPFFLSKHIQYWLQERRYLSWIDGIETGDKLLAYSNDKPPLRTAEGYVQLACILLPLLLGIGIEAGIPSFHYVKDDDIVKLQSLCLVYSADEDTFRHAGTVA